MSAWRKIMEKLRGKPKSEKVWEEDEIVKTVFSELSPNDIETLRSMDSWDLTIFHSTAGRSIRNRFDLWYHPKAKVDCGFSAFHPDNWSMRIIEKVHKEVIATYGRGENRIRIRLPFPTLFVDEPPRSG